MYNFYKFGIAVPHVKIMDCQYNAKQICEMVKSARQTHIQVIAFPQLSITGLTCMDLFKQDDLINSARESFNRLRNDLSEENILYMVGLPVKIRKSLFNCIAVCQQNKILGLVPKINLSDTDLRYFSAGQKNFSCYLYDKNLADYKIPFGDLLLDLDNKFTAKINFDTDFSPSADINLNFASNPLQLDNDFADTIIKGKCAENNNACVYVNCGFGESTTNFVYTGYSFICESGIELACSKKFQTNSQLVFQDIDFDQVNPKKSSPSSIPSDMHFTLNHSCNSSYCLNNKLFNSPQTDSLNSSVNSHSSVYVSLPSLNNISRQFPKNPFASLSHKKNFFHNLLSAMQIAIATRLSNINCKNVVIGVSGGLDSTLALLTSVLTFDRLDLPRRNIFAVTMPGFGTSSTTSTNSKILLQNLNICEKNIPISDACTKHFADIQHDPQNMNVTFENAQARERTQILFDLANDLNAIVIGTGDMSEEALGFATYNGDHISNYNPNANLPKTVIRQLINFITEEKYFDNKISDCLKNILDTPISPELLPTDENGNCSQHTENIVGPYELIDFFIYYLIKFGFSRDKILFIAQKTFDYPINDIKKYFDQFYNHFLKQQFKRSCSTDGPQFFTFGFSPRNSFLMPSDV